MLCPIYNIIDFSLLFVIYYTCGISCQGCECKESDCSGTCSCCVLSVQRWFTRGRLVASFPYHEPPMLFQCNHSCGCNPVRTKYFLSHALRTMQCVLLFTYLSKMLNIKLMNLKKNIPHILTMP